MERWKVRDCEREERWRVREKEREGGKGRERKSTQKKVTDSVKTLERLGVASFCN